MFTLYNPTLMPVKHVALLSCLRENVERTIIRINRH